MSASGTIHQHNAASDVAGAIRQTLAALGTVILGKEDQLQLALACLLARGHLLIEDLPGVGKTTLAKALARTLGLDYQRIQFTSDMLPADILGVSIYRRESDRFEFHHGPIFSELVLADEVNRATPKAQSALLEAMQEGQVTVDGKTLTLPSPFFVVATQNPEEQAGTFPLPESQLDRFLMRIELGYPAEHEERALLAGRGTAQILAQLESSLNPETVVTLQNQVDEIRLSEPLLDYLQAIVRFTRESAKFQYGLSPRGGLALMQASRAMALIQGRAAVYPDDVQTVVGPVIAHRLRPADGLNALTAEQTGRHVLDSVAIP